MFNEDNPCPIKLDDLEIYLQILKPAYILSQQFQYNHASIADVIPSIRQLMYQMKQMVLDENKKSLCNYIVTHLNEKFYFELNSCVRLYGTTSLTMLVRWSVFYESF